MPDMEEESSVKTMGVGHRRFQITAYIGGLKVLGIAYYSSDTRTTSRRASDFIHSLSQDRLTLSSPKVFERATGLVIDEPEFIVLTMQRIDAIYAKELEKE